MGLTRGTEHIAAGELPHASKELGESTTENGHADYDIRGSNATGTNVIEGKDEGRGGKREQAAEWLVIGGQIKLIGGWLKWETYSEAGLPILERGALG